MITTSLRRHDLVGNGTAGPFTYQFLIRDKTHLLVYVDGNLKSVDTHYTVAGVGSESGGTVTFTAGNEPANNAEIQFLGGEPYTQTTDYVDAGSFPAASHEEALDKLTRLQAQHLERDTRTPIMSVPDHYNMSALVLKASVPGQFLRWSALGHELEPAVPTTTPPGLPVGGNYDHLTINGSGTVAWAQQVYNFSANMVNVSKYSSFANAVSTIGSTVATLVVTSEQAVTGNVSVPATLRVLLEGQGDFNISNGIAITWDNPDQIQAHPRRRIFKGSGTVIFTKAGRVSPHWWGAVGDGSTNDGPALAAMVAACPAGTHYVFQPLTYKSNSELVVTVNDVTVWLSGATLNISSIAGTGTSGVHSSVNVLCGFKVTGDRFTMHGGRITGAVSSDGKNTVGVLASNADDMRIYGTKADTLYCGFWAGGTGGDGVTDWTLAHVEADTCSRNILLGFMPLSATNPQVNRATLLNVHSHHATGGDGVKLHTHARNVTILGGHYHHNSNNGIDLYVCGEYVTVEGAQCESNGADGIDAKYNVETGEAASQQGFARRLILAGNLCRSNTGYGIRAVVDDPYTGTEAGLESASIHGNYCEGNTAGLLCTLINSTVMGNICRANVGRGAIFQSCQNVSVIGNQFWDNGTTGANQSGCAFGLASYTSPPNNRRCLVIGNGAGDTRSGAARTQNRGYEFASMEESVVLGNSGTNHSVSDFNCAMSATLGNRSFMNAGTLEAGSTMFGVFGVPVVTTANLPAAGATQNGLLFIEDAGAGNRNLMAYAGGERFRIDGGAAV